MTRRTRWFLRFFSCALFLTVAPAVIRYSLGQRLTPLTTSPETVGAFLVRTDPRGATLTIAGVVHQNATPTAIRALQPGTHAVRIEKLGYRPWEKNLPITGMRITDVRHVRLIPERLEEQEVATEVRAFALSPRGDAIILSQETPQEQRIRIVAIDALGDPRETPLLRVKRTDEVAFRWSPNADQVLATVRGPKGGTSSSVVINRATKVSKKLRDVDEVLGWSETVAGTLVVRRGETIALLSPEGTTRTLATNVHTAARTPRGIITVENLAQGNKEIIHRSLEGTTLEEIPVPFLRAAQGRETVDALFPSPNGDLTVLVGPGRRLLLWNAQARAWSEVADHAEAVQWSPDGEKISWQSSEFDVWVMNVREQRAVLPRGSPKIVVRLSAPIRAIRWFAGSQHLLYFEKDTLKLVEIDGRDGHRTENLLGTNRGDAIAEVADDGRVLYVLASRDGVRVLKKLFLRTPEDR